MEFEKLQNIIAEVLNIEPDEKILAQIPWISSRSSWVLKKSLISRSRRRLLSRSSAFPTRLSRSKTH